VTKQIKKQSWFFAKINKINKPLSKITKREIIEKLLQLEMERGTLQPMISQKLRISR
jgi:hypothetical protein